MNVLHTEMQGHYNTLNIEFFKKYKIPNPKYNC